ncbi:MULTISPECIES: LuxR C-terminal-related transcriptional regulator [unclassified Saccharopolyspora]|uniref:LuxR C-terminal-related transcriptional regulator n=1 Tax=unclassified Saccharopolyspora TaxID=2646250 RepID=UPI001CD44353|nr:MULTISPECIES: LuxR C-terminal-related transcriptional regulator [unclassified Saccharopolyspora]MCA1194506.1 LuxR C-terminal-related transcriptional regulator [Saccharopolyspora sp. 6V]MCA1228706.1 LuxR C-terminal-related transcriptional regulator [Saccharopolyspora sp. 6M]
MTTSRYASLNLDAELTPSPLLVARLVACGLTNERIGHTLGRSANTIKTHLSAAMRKAGATTRYQLVVWLYETRHLQPGLPTQPRQAAAAELARHSPEQARLLHLVNTVRADIDAALAHFHSPTADTSRAPTSSLPVPERWTGLNYDAALSTRELELAHRLTTTPTNDAIATSLSTTTDIVKAHLRRVYSKVSARSRIHLIVWLYETGRALPGQPHLSATPRPVAQPATVDRTASHHLSVARDHLIATRALLARTARSLEHPTREHQLTPSHRPRPTAATENPRTPRLPGEHP